MPSVPVPGRARRRAGPSASRGTLRRAAGAAAPTTGASARPVPALGALPRRRSGSSVRDGRASARGASLADPMARLRSTYVCGECGGEQSRWLGRCPDCGAFATLVEQAPASEDARSGARRRGAAPGVVVPLASVETSAADAHRHRHRRARSRARRRPRAGLARAARRRAGRRQVEPDGGHARRDRRAAARAARGRRGVARAGAAARRAPRRDRRRGRAGRDRARDGLRHDRGGRARGLRRRLHPDALGRAALGGARLGLAGARVRRAPAAPGQGARASASC